MSRPFVAVLLLLAPTAGVAAPIPWEVRHPPVTQVEGTVWAGDGVVAPTEYAFERGGVLRYTYNGQTYRNGTWSQDRDAVYWETNQKYCEFRGTVRGAALTGRAWNAAGGKWELRIARRDEAGGGP